MFISGYFVFGLADFDDITILFYFFVILSFFKIENCKFSGELMFKKFILNRKIKVGISVFLILFSAWNIYMSYKEIAAQMFYSDGLKQYAAQDINGFIGSLRKAID
jgi:hypothetical protein